MAAATVQTPSHMRSLPGSVNVPVAQFSYPPTPASSIDAAVAASSTVSAINSALAAADVDTLSGLFAADGYWRDHLALSWAFRTVQTPASILGFLKHCAASRDGLRLKSVAVDGSSGVRAPKVAKIGASDTSGVSFFVTVQTVRGQGTGLVNLVRQDGRWAICTLYTRLDELHGHEQALHGRRPVGAEHGGKPGRKNWAEKRAASASYSDGSEPAVMVIGAGQAGLTAAARLKMLGVDTLAIDRMARLGDNWRARYHQLVLHDPVWYDHLPYLPFPAHWPVFTPKDKLADFFEAYASLLELNVWTRTELVSTAWDGAAKRWTVVVRRTLDDGSVQERTLHPRHVIQATGHSGKKNMPAIDGMPDFCGDRLCHSSEFPGAQPGSAGKRAIVVGSCNSAHDIAQDYLEKGYHITMVQRSSTHVVSSKAITDISLAGLYAEDGPPVEDADTLLHGVPTPVLKALQVNIVARQAIHDAPLLAGLARAGFQTDSGPDAAGLFFKYFQRGGGYYINVGASELIASGAIHVKQGTEIARVLPHGLRFADGEELEADEIVFATGYQNMRSQTRLMFGSGVADKVADVWGFNDEGEIRTMWQRSGHEGFWFHGGNLAMCRYYSKLLALQIKGLEEGMYKEGEY